MSGTSSPAWAAGWGHRATARELGITEGIYRTSGRSLEAELGARSQLELVVMAQRLGLLASRSTA